jgi:hypothetical protein
MIRINPIVVKNNSLPFVEGIVSEASMSGWSNTALADLVSSSQEVGLGMSGSAGFWRVVVSTL